MGGSKKGVNEFVDVCFDFEVYFKRVLKFVVV